MTFLAKLGKVLATIGSIAAEAAGFGPLIQKFVGAKASAAITTTTNDLTAVGQVVLSAEALIQGTGTGATKLAAATPLVAQIVQTSELVAGRKIANEPLFIQGCSNITSGTADIMNALDASGVPNPGTITVPPPATTTAPTA